MWSREKRRPARRVLGRCSSGLTAACARRAAPHATSPWFVDATGSVGTRLHTPQRQDWTVLLPRSDCSGRRALRQRRRRRSRRVPGPEPGFRPVDGRTRRGDRTAGSSATTCASRPTARAALTFTDVDGGERPRPDRLRDGRRRRRHRQRRLRGPADDVARGQSAVPQRLPRRVHRRLGAERRRAVRAGACRRRSWTSTATAGSISSSAIT